MSLRYLQITDTKALGGGELYAWKVARAAQQAGWKVGCMLPEGGSVLAEKYRASGLSVWPIQEVGGTSFSRRYQQVLRMLKLYRAVQTFRPDVVQLVLQWQTQAPDILSVLAATGRPLQVVLQLVDPALAFSGRNLRGYRRVAQAFPGGIVAVSESSRAALARLAQLPETAFSVIENGAAPVAPVTTQVREQKRGEIERRFQIPPGRKLLLTVGNLMARKGYFYLLPAVAELARTRSDFHCLWLGEGGGRKELEEAIAFYKADSFVTLAGRQNAPEDFYAAADAFVFPSLLEGYSFALLEAMAHGLPVLASDCIGNVDAVQDGRNGRLFRTADSIAIWRVLGEFLDHPEQAAGWAAEARATVEKFSEAAMLGRTLQALQALAKKLSP